MKIKTYVLTPLLFLALSLQAGSTRSDEPKRLGFYAQDPATQEKFLLPLESTDVDLEITAGINYATVTQTYINQTTHNLEAVYIFPLPAKATVTDMELRVEDRVIRSVVQKRKEAKKTYETAKEAGKKAALVEQERPNIFTTSVANLEPGQRVSIRFRYMEVLPYRKGEYSLSFPMVVGQRYLPMKVHEFEDGTYSQSPQPQEANRINPPLLPLGTPEQPSLRLQARITGLVLDSIESTTHRVSVTQQDSGRQTYVVNLSKGRVVANSDFNLKLHLEENSIPQVSFVQSSQKKESYGLLTIAPPTLERSEAPPPPRDVIFLLDTSGSMSGASIGQAKSGLLTCMEMLRPEDRFNIIRFAHEYSSFAPDFRQATTEKLNQATGYIQRLVADGGTEMHPALREALSMTPKEGHLKLVIFMTDGNVGNEDDLMRLLHQELGNTRLFTFAIGSAPNEHLIRTMAEQGRGQARFIRSHEDIGNEMSDFFRTLEAPVLTDISVDWVGAGGDVLEKISMYPSKVPDVFIHRPIQLIATSPRGFSGQVVVSGTIEGKSVTYPFEIPPTEGSYAAIEKLAGKAMIDERMVDYVRADTPVIREQIQEGIEKIALQHQLVSKFTSRVAVEEEVTVNPEGKLETVQVRVPLPKGWDPTKFHATATQDVLFMLIGGQLLLVGILMHAYRKRVAS